MNRPALLLSLFVAGIARGAEDHSAHRHEPARAATDQPTESERAHVPPAPPQHVLPHLSEKEMIEQMQMNDTALFGKILLDQLEWRETDDRDALHWDAHAWYGGDYNKLWLKTEGERAAGEEAGGVELLWDRVATRWWSVQAGVRHDFSDGPSRTWAALGVQGLAPYWFEIEATLYVGEEGRSALRFVGEYELLLTQRWVLQPKLEMNLYGKEDADNGLGSGLANADVGLRLRYEIRREFAPYVGIVWSREFGETADLARQAGGGESEVQWVAGMRIWF